MAPPQGKLPVVLYRCEWCRATLARTMSEHSNGLCPHCTAPMRIDDVFSDRRGLQRPVPLERRAA